MKNTNLRNIGNEVPGVHTKKEIFQQPLMWQKTLEIIRLKKAEIIDFFDKLDKKNNIDMILTGAGSSAFIGNAVFGVRTKFQSQPSRVIPTTELITHPEYFLMKAGTTVLVSFARSGNSPESIAAVDIVNSYCENAYHILITCNEEGDLYQKSLSHKVLKILLPPETNDVSLAMTSSFSSMMLAFILISKIGSLDNENNNIKKLCEWGSRIITEYDTLIKDIATLDFNRVVFLGSGLLRGTAEESHLKLQELTDGAVICTYNSFLGFRHGPRAVVNEHTLLVYLFADDDHSRKYEYDLVTQINQTNNGLAQISVAHKPVNIEGVKFDLDICFGGTGEEEADIEYLCVADVLVAQLLGYHKSIYFGLNPDSPSKSGTISRVVEGVKIYHK
jgi:tagatose-6-phosphate ketose/aldose isomerase